MRPDLEPSLVAADYPYSHRIRVRFAETDAMGIVHHSNYLLYLEETRVEYLRHLERPYTDLRADGVDLAVLECHLRYRRPLRFDEQLDVHTMLVRPTRATLRMAYLLTVDGEVRATAVTAHGAVNGQGRPVRMPPWLTALAIDM